MNGFYDLGDLLQVQARALTARALELRGGATARRLDGKALGLLFLSPSLRTQASFQRAAWYPLPWGLMTTPPSGSRRGCGGRPWCGPR